MSNRVTDSFERDLAALHPAPASANQASFYFRAGQASRDRAVRTWQCIGGAALALMVAAVGLSFWRIADPEARVAETDAVRIPNPVIVPAPADLPSAPQPSPSFADEDTRPYAPPMTPRAIESDPTAAELAATLELRRNILTAGTTYLDAQSRNAR